MVNYEFELLRSTTNTNTRINGLHIYRNEIHRISKQYKEIRYTIDYTAASLDYPLRRNERALSSLPNSFDFVLGLLITCTCKITTTIIVLLYLYEYSFLGMVK